MKIQLLLPRSFSFLTACLLSSSLFSSLSLAQSVHAEVAPATRVQLLASENTASSLTLMEEDVPDNFTELPPALRAQLATQMRAISQQLGGADLNPDNLAVFVNPRDFQIVMGFTSKLETPTAQAEFDANLKKLENPEVRKLVLATIQQKLASFPLGDLEISNLAVLPEQNNLANASTGVTLELKLQGQSFRVDLIPFRRDEVGAVAAVFYAKDGESLAVRNFAEKLDRRILNRS
ncbi:hypothetical protein [Oscillatoria sp. FACHB-1406]|uniref:hypothetical protein n=1 Tax=Oscillatoria sp. FACHB-1406 TaxID=2692846 RepID=UPI001687933C|nr:hypothetical protein [Oscillatoria sp. FACHB-1406]MBD2576974.1 hypothetical protein [Oscillatoria sp. FACHB-1406]